MSLDVYLEGTLTGQTSPKIFIREGGSTREISLEEWDRRFPGQEPVSAETPDYLFTANITHNLGRMAQAAGIYQVLWRPEELRLTYAGQLVDLLRDGLRKLKDDPDFYRQYNPENGWGSYEGLVQFVENYLAACEENPAATVRVWR